MFDATPDEHLLALIAQHSEPALEALYDRHARAVYSLARKVLRASVDAEEVMQDVFVRVWKKAGEFDATRGSATAWLMTVAHHAAVDAYRRRRTERDHTEPLEDGVLNAPPVTPDHASDALERLSLDQALASLETSERAVLEGLYFTGLSQSQLAAQTGMPLGTLKTRARNALQRLRAFFGERGAP
jgi:RNA polymerase sigma-70 factor (ECF subfamily)